VFNDAPSLQTQRNRLPIACNQDHVLYLDEQHQVVIMVGDTGCGKSLHYLVEVGWFGEPGR
jgi:ATP-dependent RNA helicase DDX35